MDSKMPMVLSITSLLLSVVVGAVILVSLARTRESERVFAALMDERIADLINTEDTDSTEIIENELEILQGEFQDYFDASSGKSDDERTLYRIGQLESAVQRLLRSQESSGSRLAQRFDELEQAILNRPDPSYVMAEEYAQLGAEKSEFGEYNKAATFYRDSLDYSPSNDVKFAYAEALYQSDPDVRDDEQIMESLEAVLALDPHREDALSLLGEVAMEQGDVDKAAESYSVLYALQLGDGEEAALAYGRLLMLQQRYSEAIEPLSVASESYPGDPAILSDLGSSLAALGRHDEAVDTFRDSLESRTNYPPALLGLSESLLALGQGEDAASQAALYTAIRVDDFNGYLIEGDGHTMAGHPVKAEIAWKNALGALEMNSRQDVLNWTTVSVRLGKSYMERAKYSKALECSIQALEYEENSDLLTIAADASRALGDVDAVEQFEKRRDKVTDMPSISTGGE